ncbi:DNA cytosine methyltransferase [Pseudoduganella chitinolytica]|uniref:DNA cytosine methyltransferase n=1 Tax=Pseudoduganella chitinolytica TaxID=34070 RepID=A0ABY8BNS6_9BURK|nr:DNA cytosine methyltransferase [Pseudoduganella chitinolytica]
MGVWSHALRRAGWADDRPVWTGSCPCQPFSAAGKGLAFADERHLWPAFYHLITECRPAAVLGEQVASAAVDDWIDLVHADLEAVGYAFGSVPFPSAGVGAPHIRDRNYWVAHAGGDRRDQQCGVAGKQAGARQRRDKFDDGRSTGRLADANGGHASAEREQRGRKQRQQPGDGCVVRLGHANGEPAGRHAGSAYATQAGHGSQGGDHHGLGDAGFVLGAEQPGPTNGYWRAADWLGCTDGRWRPVEPGTFPLAHGAAARVGRLRAYGNAINASAAEVFIRCVMECAP